MKEETLSGRNAIYIGPKEEMKGERCHILQSRGKDEATGSRQYEVVFYNNSISQRYCDERYLQVIKRGRKKNKKHNKPSYKMLSVDDIDFGSIEEKPQPESKDHFESVMQNSFSKTFIEELEIGRRLYEDRQDIEIVRQITELIMLVKRYYNTNLVKK